MLDSVLCLLVSDCYNAAWDETEGHDLESRAFETSIVADSRLAEKDAVDFWKSIAGFS